MKISSKKKMLNKTYYLVLLLVWNILMSLTMTSCGSMANETGQTITLSANPSHVETSTPASSSTPSLVESPDDIATPATGNPNLNPLTGLVVNDSTLLERRPLAIKVSNYPRAIRPQWGLSLADLVYEYYIEGGETRFAAIYYGNNSEMVGPIRSARYFDINILQMYKAVFAFGSGDERVWDRLYTPEFKDLLVSEYPATCPPMCRYDPSNWNHLVTDTSKLSAYITDQGVDNNRQDLSGMVFNEQIPPGSQPGERLTVRYSCWSYNRWDYDAGIGKYLRSEEAVEDTGLGETYTPLIDRLTEQPVGAENVVILLMQHDWVSVEPEMIDMQFAGEGTAYAFRDGMIYTLKWQRSSPDRIVSLTYADGTVFALKPGTTWYQIIGASAPVIQNGEVWQFAFRPAALYTCPGVTQK